MKHPMRQKVSAFATFNLRCNFRPAPIHEKTAVGRQPVLQNTLRYSWSRNIHKHIATADASAQKPTRTNQTISTSQAELLLVYTPPVKGLISKLPAAWIPYAELIRLDKPTGTYYLYFPCLFSTLMAAPMTDVTLLHVFSTSALFFAGALVMRGAGCTINDLWDRNLDPHVTRTKFRPLARRAISVENAITYLGFQMMGGLAILLQFPVECLTYGVPSLLLVGTYPLAKRVTNYPQAVLGLTFSWGAFMGFPALGIDLLANSSALFAATSLYASCVAWTVNYDMIYAHMDIKDDVNAGIKSIARAHEHNTKAVLSLLSVTQIGFLALSGSFAGAGPVFYAVCCGGTAVTLATIIRRVKLKDVKNCWWWFKNGAWLTGGSIGVGLVGDLLYRRYFPDTGTEVELVDV